MTGADNRKALESRFYELDILRGLAAFIVVSFHYKHFMLISDTAGFDYIDMPFKSVMMPVYVYGQFFVEMFFSISGYVFFWLYSGAIAERSTGLREFFVARFARLYPLYFLTLVLVALMQWGFRSLYGQDYIYSDNTAANFLFSLLMVQQWLPVSNQTFNGPSWSISVEVFLYTIFFLLCRLRLKSVWVVLAMIAAGLMFKYFNHNPSNDFARGLPSFFFGGLVWYVVEALQRREAWRKAMVRGLAILLPILWGLAYIGAYDVLWGPDQLKLLQAGLPRQGVHAVLLSTEMFVYGLIPLTLLFFGLQKGQWRAAWLQPQSLRRFEWIGDISYSLYLIHFPLQIGLMLILAHWPFAVRARIFSSPLAYAVFMATAMGLAWLSYRYFEMPMRRHIRGWLSQRLVKA